MVVFLCMTNIATHMRGLQFPYIRKYTHVLTMRVLNTRMVKVH